MASTTAHLRQSQALFTSVSKYPLSAPDWSQPRQIVNPVTGDRMMILCSTGDSQGKYLKVQFDLPAGSNGSPLHYHGNIAETFEVLNGSLEMEVGEAGNIKVLQPGDIVQVPLGMHHSFRNASDDWVTFTSEMRPAGGFEQFLRAWYGLAIDGEVNEEGVPTNPFKLAVLVQKADTIMVGQPLWVQQLAVGVLTWMARLLKVEQSMSHYCTTDPREV